MNPSNVCNFTSLTFVPVRRMYQSDVCTSPTFEPVRRLFQSDVCASPTFVSQTFVLSDLCTVRRLYKDIRFRKFDFVAKTPLLCFKASAMGPRGGTDLKFKYIPRVNTLNTFNSYHSFTCGFKNSLMDQVSDIRNISIL